MPWLLLFVPEDVDEVLTLVTVDLGAEDSARPQSVVLGLYCFPVSSQVGRQYSQAHLYCLFQRSAELRERASEFLVLTLNTEVFGVAHPVTNVDLVRYEEVLIKLRLKPVYLVDGETIRDHKLPRFR